MQSGGSRQSDRSDRRQTRGLVRRASLLLSGEQPLPDLLKDLAELVASSFDAGVGIEYVGTDGMTELHEYGSRDGSSTVVGVPAVFSGVALGELRLHVTEPLDADDVAVLEACAVFLGARLHDERQRLRAEHLERLALTDALTGVANRRSFDDTMAREWNRARRNGTSLAMVMIDIDLFKRYNDSYGHRVGDECLRKVAQAAVGCLRRPGDFFGRYGGEEFAAILPETGLEGALMVAEGMRVAVSRLSISHGGSGVGSVSISAGVAQCVPKETGGAPELITSADAALYAAKSEGRNRVVGAHTLFPDDFDVRLAGGNLPTRPTRFVGHADEVVRLAGALELHPIVTITGPGGVGKTRTSIELAKRLGSYFPDGIWFVNLSLLDDGADVVPFVCETLRTVAPLARDASTFALALADKRLMLLLDNCEHVAPQVAALADAIVATAPQVRVLATSREPLKLEREIVHRLGSLSLEDAIELFTDRARTAGIELGDERRAVIAAIVQQLDAIPLAIELAAPQLRAMGPEDLLQRLDDRLQLLALENRGAENRQQTLEAMLDWSHRLLGDAGRKLFRRLAIFVGGASLEAAMHVCVDEAFDEARLRDALEDLVAKSLVVLEPITGGLRYRMLEITRAYAQSRLVDSKEFDDAAHSHVRYFATLAKRFEARLDATPVAAWQAEVMLDGQNFRAALSLAFDAGDVEGAAGICEALHYWLWEYGAVHASDLTRRVATVLATTLEPSSEAPLRLAYAALLRRSDRPRALESARRALDVYRSHGSPIHVADALRGTVGLQHEVYGAPSPLLIDEMRQTIDTMLECGSTLRAAELLNNLGVSYAQLLEDTRLKDALVCFERAASLLEARGDGDRSGRVIGNSAATAFLLGDLEHAVRRSRRAVELFDRSADSWFGGRQWSNHGYYLAELGRFEEARVALGRGIGLARRLSDRVGVISGLEYAAHLKHLTGKNAIAARLIGFADNAHSNGMARQARGAALLRELSEKIREDLGGDVFDRESKFGSKSSVEEMIRDAGLEV